MRRAGIERLSARLNGDANLHAGGVGERSKLTKKLHTLGGAPVQGHFRRRRMEEQQFGVMTPSERQRMREHVPVSIVNSHRNEHT